ncbi:MAG: class II D-tagatose-bisphosphate aldolase, non-catalytic subunit [Vallitaleaceae bacterium]|jgi:D-tagatose-1,6-bisphosphate aldolase subunit GatZ/KbaZ|nr:class II D-tagatose-bisphosphate aldolase, non-catalytic subunit [Vallitaleaceae bacterium]
MVKAHTLKEIVRLQKRNIPVGITSICSANKMVLEAVMIRALTLNNDVLIEATANQVNQFGGYTGMKPIDFTEFVYGIAERIGFPKNKLILAGDHLGPLTWVDLPEDEAMANAETLVYDFVKAGFTKIHLDTSMKLSTDPVVGILSTEVIADRGARLALKCKQAFEEYLKMNPDAMSPVYVIGSEVPIPGGAQEEEEDLQVTKVTDLIETIDLFKAAFSKYELKDIWEDVIAVVVQPGVEFGDDTIHEYNREAAKDLVKAIEQYPNLVFEGHSTDYQTPQKLRELVEDGVAILKVGPAVTFALREGLFALARIEDEITIGEEGIRSNLIDVIEDVMLESPKNWKKHYHGSESEMKLARTYSFADRVRFYIGSDKVQRAIDLMFENLSNQPISFSLLSQYAPIQYHKIRKGILNNNAYDIALDAVINVVDEYNYAIFPDTLVGIKHHLA